MEQKSASRRADWSHFVIDQPAQFLSRHLNAPRRPVFVQGCFSQTSSFPFVNNLAFDLFWIFFLACLTRVTLLPDLNSLAWAVADGITVLAFVQNPSLYLETFKRNILLLSWPMIAILSSIWSLLPQVSFYHSIQFILNSFVAFVMIRHAGLDRFIRILFFFNFTLQGLSLLLMLVNSGLSLDAGGNFKGVYLHKNELGVFSTLQIICATALFLSGWKKWLSGSALLLAFLMLLKSGSGTSTLLAIFVLGLYPVFLVIRRGFVPAGIMIGILIAIAAAVALGIVVSQIDVVNLILSALGKDPGLTGRDIIWTIGMDAAVAMPVLGHGFLAYWGSGESTAGYLRYVLKQDLVAFHNVYLETTVAFGLVGLTLLIVGLLQQIVRAFLFLLRRGDIIALTPLVFILWMTMLSLSENPIFWNSQTHFMVMCFAAITCSSTSAINEK